jgi:hypothetical protein
MWKDFYARERAGLDLEALVDGAPPAELPAIFRHTKLAATGRMVASVARAVVASGADRVLAIGVLHQVPGPRGVHGPDGVAADEFSLDGFSALVAAAARLLGRPMPQIIARFPLLAGGDPEELVDDLPRDLPVVATADPIHHGPGYGDLGAGPLAVDDARARVDASLALLADGRWDDFQRHAAANRNDFKNAGPVFALLTGARVRVRALELVDYADVFGAPAWVAGALAW